MVEFLFKIFPRKNGLMDFNVPLSFSLMVLSNLKLGFRQSWHPQHLFGWLFLTMFRISMFWLKGRGILFLHGILTFKPRDLRSGIDVRLCAPFEVHPYHFTDSMEKVCTVIMFFCILLFFCISTLENNHLCYFYHMLVIDFSGLLLSS